MFNFQKIIFKEIQNFDSIPNKEKLKLFFTFSSIVMAELEAVPLLIQKVKSLYEES